MDILKVRYLLYEHLLPSRELHQLLNPDSTEFYNLTRYDEYPEIPILDINEIDSDCLDGNPWKSAHELNVTNKYLWPHFRSMEIARKSPKLFSSKVAIMLLGEFSRNRNLIDIGLMGLEKELKFSNIFVINPNEMDKKLPCMKYYG